MIFQMTTPQMELWRIDGPFSNALHMHEEHYQITVPMYGTCRFTQENREYKLTEGAGLVQYPGDRHVFDIGQQSGVLIFIVKHDGLRSFSQRDSLELSMNQRFDCAHLGSRFSEWMNALLTYDAGDQLAQEEVETRVFHYLCHSLSGSHKAAGFYPELNGAAARGSDPYMTQALEYIHAHFRESITVGELAAVAMRSQYHFIRTFKSAFGATPYQYVHRLRIQEAKELLRGTSRSHYRYSAWPGLLQRQRVLSCIS